MVRLLKAAFESTGGRKRRTAIVIGAIGVTAGLVMASDKPKLSDASIQPITITARSISSFDKNNLTLKTFGKLEWLGGMQLTSPSKHFGGWSGLRLDPKGKSLLAISDAGTWMRADVKYAKDRPVGLANARIGVLRALSGKPLSRTRDRDAEALELKSGTLEKGEAIIAFEQNDRVGVFPIRKGVLQKPKRYLKLPDGIRLNRSINGVESLAVIRKGKRKNSILAFLESRLTPDGYHRGWMVRGRRAEPVFLKDIGGYAITDLASMPSGDLLVLERRFRWSEGVKLRLRRLSAEALRKGARLTGQVLLEADMKQHIDNMEGLAIHAHSDGRAVVTLISDDNFNPILQRTLLLQFALDPKVLRKPIAKRQQTNS